VSSIEATQESYALLPRRREAARLSHSNSSALFQRDKEPRCCPRGDPRLHQERNHSNSPSDKASGRIHQVGQGWRTAGRARKRLGETRGSGAKPQRGLGRQPQGLRSAGRTFLTEGGAPMPILHCGLVWVAKKSYWKCTRKSCPFANAPQKRPGGRPIRPGSGGGQTRGGHTRFLVRICGLRPLVCQIVNQG
jgi:hypothetical protein